MGRSATVNVGDVIGAKYEILDVLGSGGMAMVYKARNTRTRQLCAVKMILPQWVTNAQVVERFLDETQVAAKIGKHPNIVDVLDADEDAERGVPFLVMELLEGESLQQRMRGGPLSFDESRPFLVQLGDALALAHGAGVVHRDLKPGNLFLARDHRGRSTLKILDFGIAKVLQEQNTHTATNIGTPFYAAPEQLGPTIRKLAARQKIEVATGVSPATDVWALGLIVFEMLTGSGPGHYWDATTAADLPLQLAERIGAPVSATERAGKEASRLPPGFDAWFARCLSFDASTRYGTGGEAIDALLQLSEGQGLSADSGRISGPSTRFAQGVSTFVGPSSSDQGDSASARPGGVDTHAPSVPATPAIAQSRGGVSRPLVGIAVAVAAAIVSVMLWRASTSDRAASTLATPQPPVANSALAKAAPAVSKDEPTQVDAAELPAAPQSEDAVSANARVSTEFKQGMDVYARTAAVTFEKGRIDALKKGKALVNERETGIEDLTPARGPTSVEWLVKDVVLFEQPAGRSTAVSFGVVQRVRIDGQLTVKVWDGKQYIDVVFSPPAALRPGHLPLTAAIPVRSSWVKELSEEVEQAEARAIERKRKKCLADVVCKKRMEEEDAAKERERKLAEERAEADRKRKECLADPECKRQVEEKTAAAVRAEAQRKATAAQEEAAKKAAAKEACLSRCDSSSDPGGCIRSCERL